MLFFQIWRLIKSLYLINKQVQFNINPLVEIPGDFWLTTIKHRFGYFIKNLPFLTIISNSNAFKCSKFEFKLNNLYPDIYIINLIKKTALLIDFSLHTAFELDYFGLIRNLVVLVEDESEPRVRVYINCPCKSFFLCKSNPNSD